MRILTLGSHDYKPNFLVDHHPVAVGGHRPQPRSPDGSECSQVCLGKPGDP